MTDAPSAYPLAWPAHKPRLRASERKVGQFKRYSQDLTIAQGATRLEAEVERLGGQYLLISSNVEVTLSGRPRSGGKAPTDPGVCVYFHLKETPYALACDRYTTVADNLAAIAAHIAATRAITRHGVASAAETLQAFQALPPPSGQPAPARPWWETFGIMRNHADADTVNALYRIKAKAIANDAAALTELNVARDAALAELQP